MSLEAKAIVNRAQAPTGKMLVLERFESDGNMKVSVGEQKAVTQINDVSGALERIFKMVKEYEVELKIPMQQNPGYDMAPSAADPRVNEKRHWADLPNDEKAVQMLVEEVKRVGKEYEAALAAHNAKKAGAAAAENEAPKPERKKPGRKSKADLAAELGVPNDAQTDADETAEVA